ncbi:MAG: cell division protein FtsQ/DivIB [Pseudomonadota bacterium]
MTRTPTRKTKPAATKAKVKTKATSSTSRRKPSSKTQATSPRIRRARRALPWRSLSLVALVTAILASGHWLWTSGQVEAAYDDTVEAAYAFSVDAGFAVTSIQVLGRSESKGGEILEALEMERGDPILRFDPQEARDRIEALPWVESASVQRRLPGLIRVEIAERRPAALWQLGGVWSVIDKEGTVIEGASAGAFPALPKVVGPGANSRVDEVLALVSQQPELSMHVYAAIRVGNRRWNLRLHSGIDVRLPENDPVSAWERLARLESLADLLARDVSVIDLRREDRLLLRLAPDAELVPLVEGQET